MGDLLLFNLKTDADDPVLGFTTSWINSLAKDFRRVTVITMMTGRLAVAGNVEVLSVGKEKGFSEPRRVIEFYRLLARALRVRQFSCCFAHMMPLFLVLAAPALKARGIRSVLWYTHRKLNLLLRIADMVADAVVTASPESYPLPGPKVSVVGHGIDTEVFSPSGLAQRERTRLHIATVGRITPVKRLEEILGGLAELRRARPQVRASLSLYGPLVVAGDAAYRRSLEERIALLGLPEAVVFRGSVPFNRVAEAYREADCFVNMCATGGIDKAVLEAMSCGIPIVTSNSAFAGVLGPGLAAEWIIAPGDSAALADRLDRLHAMGPEGREELGARMRQKVLSGYSLEGLAGRIARILRQDRARRIAAAATIKMER